LVRDASHIIEREPHFRGGPRLARHEFRHTPQIGRTTAFMPSHYFGLKIANWFAENQRNIARSATPPHDGIGKIPAPSQRSHLGPESKENCRKLGLQVTPVATQVIQRDRHAQYSVSLR